jgi:hypothetical protein
MHDPGGNPEAMPRRDDEIAAFRHHRGDADGLKDELPPSVRVPRAPALGRVCRRHGDNGPILRLQVAGIIRRGYRPASLVVRTFKTVAAGRCRADSYIYIHLNS